ncbi:MAG: type IV secretory system conjugative DNA transfer family protein [Nitrospira sp.]|nr:MAG: type IV secretory system conjugative DNA transfer family protein [Nitrospira sp.]
MTLKIVVVALAVLLYVPVGLVGADCLAGVLFDVTNKRVPDSVSWGKWPDAWLAYRDDATQRKRLQFSAGLGLFTLFGLPVLLGLSLTHRTTPLHGAARFASPSEIAKAGLYGEQGIIVGKYGRRYLIYGGQEFVLLAAPTRSGKGVSVVLPNLLNYHDSVVVLDIKMENFAYTSKFRQQHGQEVYLFNPFGQDQRSHRWNPLDAVPRDPHLRVGEIQAIGHVLYPTEHVKDAFWNESARNLFLGLCLYLMETPTLPCSLGELLRQASGKGQPIKDYLQGLMTKRGTGEQPLSEDCTGALQRFCTTSDNTMAGILATFTALLTIFSNPIVDAATSATEIDLSAVRKRRLSIYVGIPANRLSDAAMLVNLFFSQLIHRNTVELPAANPALKYHCVLFLDEFPAIGRVEILAKAVGFLAGYNLRLVPIIQSLSQLASIYGEKDARTFVTNHACQVMFAPREQQDANEYSQMLGTYTAKAISTGMSQPRGWGQARQASTSSNSSDHARPLMLPQELKELGPTRQIISLSNTKPILCDKAFFYLDPVFVNRLKEVSPSLAAVGNRLPTQTEFETAAFVQKELSSSTCSSTGPRWNGACVP